MRILIHGINYAPELVATGKYTAEMAEWLAGRGHDVRVITAPPYYPAWKVEKGYSSWFYRKELLFGVTVWRCPLWVPKRPKTLTRLLHLATFALSSFPVLIGQVFWRPDVIFVVEPPLFCAPQALLAARLSGAKAWLHVQDFEIEAFFGLGFGSSSSLKRLVIKLESYLMRRFDHLSTISPTMLQRLLRLNIPRERASLFPNWVDLDTIRPVDPVSDLRAEWGIASDRKIVLYAGNMGEKQGLEIVLDAATILNTERQDIVFLMVGDGASRDKIAADAEQRQLRNVLFKPLQPLNKLHGLLSTADVHLVVQKRGAADAVMPSKLTGILAAGGRAVITADHDTELGRMVNDYPGIAQLVPPDNSPELAKAISEMLAAQDRFNPVARAFAEKHLAMQAILQGLERQLSALCSDHDAAGRSATG